MQRLDVAGLARVVTQRPAQLQDRARQGHLLAPGIRPDGPQDLFLRGDLAGLGGETHQNAHGLDVHTRHLFATTDLALRGSDLEVADPEGVGSAAIGRVVRHEVAERIELEGIVRSFRTTP